MRFVFFVEGHTEKEILGPFLRRWLNSRLDQRVGIKTVNFEGWHRLVEDMPRKAKMYLEASDSGELIALITLLDLYGPDFYPHSSTSVDDRVQWATKHLENKVKSDKFRVFFAVHETEAWLFSQPQLFPTEVQQALPNGKPEGINFDTPPSKCLNNIYLNKLKRKYRKVTDGKNLFTNLDPEVAYGQCPYLKQMLDEMLRMAKESGL